MHNRKWISTNKYFTKSAPNPSSGKWFRVIYWHDLTLISAWEASSCMLIFNNILKDILYKPPRLLPFVQHASLEKFFLDFMRSPSRRGSRLTAGMEQCVQITKWQHRATFFKLLITTSASNQGSTEAESRWAPTGDAIVRRLSGSLPSLRFHDVLELWRSEHCWERQQAQVKESEATDLETWREMLQDLLGNPYPRPRGGPGNNKAE